LTYLKGFVLVLALANVGYFLWARGIAPQPAAAPAAKSASTLKLVSEVPGTGAARPAAPAAAPSPESEPGAASAPAAAAPSVEPAAPGTLLSDVKRCISIGPFPDVSEASHAAATLRSGGYAPRQRVTEGEVWAGVWVYLPLPGTAAAADQVRAKLKGGGIDDELDMPGPNDTPVMSLGLFSDARRAQARVAQVQGLGLNPATADRKRNGDVYWVDVDLKPTDGMLNPADLQGETGRIIRLQVKACPASTGAAP
jgi:hypothetical protein